MNASDPAFPALMQQVARERARREHAETYRAPAGCATARRRRARLSWALLRAEAAYHTVSVRGQPLVITDEAARRRRFLAAYIRVCAGEGW